MAQKRIETVQPELFHRDVFNVRSKKETERRIPFSALVESGYLKPGQILYFRKNKYQTANIKPDSRLRTEDGFEGSIHQAGSHYMNGSPCNGWEHWYVHENGELICLDEYRQRFRIESKNINE